MYALVEYKGKQYKAEKDGLIQVDKLDAKKGQTIDINNVQMPLFFDDRVNYFVYNIFLCMIRPTKPLKT